MILWISLLGCVCLIFSVAWADEIRYDKANRRDPFVPLVGPHALHGRGVMGNGGFHIEGIIFDPSGGSVALMAGEIVREGDEIQGAKLVRILPDRVVFLQEGEETIVWLRDEIAGSEPGAEKPG